MSRNWGPRRSCRARSPGLRVKFAVRPRLRGQRHAQALDLGVGRLFGWRGCSLTLLARLRPRPMNKLCACKQAARPTVVACVHRRWGQADRDTLIEQCRQSVGVPFVKACVQREEQKEAAPKPAPPAPKIEELSQPSGVSALVRPSFMAPPRRPPTSERSWIRRNPTRRRSRAQDAADVSPRRRVTRGTANSIMTAGLQGRCSAATRRLWTTG